MKYLLVLFVVFSFQDVFAFGFDPALITAMDNANVSLEEELATAEPASCKKLLGKNVNPKSKSYRTCQNYRTALRDYQASIFNAKRKIQLLDGWMPTERLFVDRSNNFAFLTQPSKSIPMFNKELINKLDLLYTSIYQYPITQ